MISLVDSMNDLKKTFENIKMVPEKPIKIDPTNIAVRKVDLNDRVLQLFYESFVSGSHVYLLNQEVENVVESPRRNKPDIKAKKKARGQTKGAKAKAKAVDSTVAKVNEIEEKKQEIKEISDDIVESMAYLVENKYSLQLKQQRKKKGILLEEKKQEEIKKLLNIDINELKDPKKKVTVEDVIEKINTNIEKKAEKVKKKAKLTKKTTSNKLEEIKENIFMGEDMNAKIPFQDCIEVQFGENGNIEYFKLRKNLTRLAAEKNEIEMIEMIKNFEYSISLLNKALNLSEKKEFISDFAQTDPQKPILLTFMKQLVADFESYEGGEAERKEIEEELKDYSEAEFLNMDITKLKSSNEKAMTMKELMFSFFEYTKQKAISLSYHYSEEQK